MLFLARGWARREAADQRAADNANAAVAITTWCIYIFGQGEGREGREGREWREGRERERERDDRKPTWTLTQARAQT